MGAFTKYTVELPEFDEQGTILAHNATSAAELFVQRFDRDDASVARLGETKVVVRNGTRSWTFFVTAETVTTYSAREAP